MKHCTQCGNLVEPLPNFSPTTNNETFYGCKNCNIVFSVSLFNGGRERIETYTSYITYIELPRVKDELARQKYHQPEQNEPG